MRFWLAAGVAVLSALAVAGASGGAQSATSAVPVAHPFIIGPPEVIVGEGDGFAQLTVKLSAPGLNTVSVSFRELNRTAIAGTVCDADYVENVGTLNFLPGETSKQVSVQILDCPSSPTTKGLKTFLFDLFQASETVAQNDTTVSIVDKRATVTTPQVFVRDAVVDEAAGEARIPVLLGGVDGQASAGTVTVDYVTSDGTAKAGSDYTASGTQTLTFLPGHVVQTIVVPLVVDDATAEPAEDFFINLGNATNSTIADGRARVVIGANGGPALAAPFISVQPDVVVGETDGYIDLAIGLSAPGLNAVAVRVRTLNVNAVGGVACDADYVNYSFTVVFLPGETTRIMRVPILNCPVVEGLETFTFDLFQEGSPVARRDAIVTIVDSTVSLTGLAVTPVNKTIAKGTSQQFTAIGTYSNFSILDLTTTAAWASGGSAAATVGFDGLAHAQSEGASSITATVGAFSDSTLLTVGPPVLAGISVTPAGATIVTAADQQFTATGTLTDRTTTDLTATANWSSATPTVATVAAGGLAHAIGVGTSLLSASFGGITGSTTLTVGKANQTITFAALADRTFGDADFALGATSTSNLTVGFNAAGSCTVSGTTVHITAAGSCTITASQTGNANYNAATSVPRTFQIAKADQPITVNTHAPATAAGGSSFFVSASAPGGSVTYSSSGACTNSGSSFSAASAGGTCTVKYDQAGNTNYNAASQVTESVTVTATSVPPTITFGSLASKTFGDADFSISASSTSGLAVSFAASGNCTVSGSTVHITGAGSCTVTASQGAATPVLRSFTIGKPSQTITFAALSSKTFGDANFDLAATASSGLAVSYTASGNCTVSGATVHLTAAGSCTITAAQAGDTNYSAASSVSRSFTIEANLTPPPPSACKTPKLTGQTLAAAKRAIASAGCNVGVVTYTYSTRKKGTVVSQSRSGTYIDIVISSGPVPKALAEAVITGRCNRITARLLLARFRLGDLGDPKLRDPVSQVLCGAFAGKGSRAMAVTLAIPACGRTGGWVVFRWNGRAWRVLLKRTGGADLAAVGTTIRETMFVFKSGDKHCSPTGGTRSRVWHWTGRRLLAGPWKRKR